MTKGIRRQRLELAILTRKNRTLQKRLSQAILITMTFSSGAECDTIGLVQTSHMSPRAPSAPPTKIMSRLNNKINANQKAGHVNSIVSPPNRDLLDYIIGDGEPRASAAHTNTVTKKATAAKGKAHVA